MKAVQRIILQEVVKGIVNQPLKKGVFMANQVIYGIVNNRQKAEKLIQDLMNLGVNSEEISFLSSHGDEFHDLQVPQSHFEGNRNWRTEDRVTDYPHPMSKENVEPTSTSKGRFKANRGGLGAEKHTKAPEGATTGATAGGIIGGTLGLLAGIGALAIPGVGPFIAAGPLLATLSGIGAGGTLGGIIGALAGAGIPEYEAKHYENRLQEGGILISVQTNSDQLAKKIKDLFQLDGAEDVSISSDAKTSKRYK